MGLGASSLGRSLETPAVTELQATWELPPALGVQGGSESLAALAESPGQLATSPWVRKAWNLSKSRCTKLGLERQQTPLCHSQGGGGQVKPPQ